MLSHIVVLVVAVRVNVEEEVKKVDEVVKKLPSEKARLSHVNKLLSSTVDKQGIYLFIFS